MTIDASTTTASQAGTARIVLFGAVPEIDEQSSRVALLRCSPDDPLDDVAIAMIVLDLRAFRADVLARVRRRPGLADAPALVVSDDEVDDDVLAALGASDILLFPASRAVLERRLATLVELGQRRFALREAETSAETLRRLLLDQRAYEHAILDGVTVGIVTSDDDGVVTFVNERARQLLECDPRAGEDVGALLDLAERPHELLGSQGRRSLSYELTTRQGTRLEIDLSITRCARTQEERCGLVFIFQDARAQRELEEERRRFDRLVAMGTMVAGFAHEIRNPVAALLSIAEEVDEELTAAGFDLPHIARMVKILQRIERLVRTSLQFGRPAAPLRGRHRPWTIITNAVAEVGPRTRATGEELRVDIEPELPDVFCDDGQIAQALVILLNNALDATGAPSRVLVRATRYKGLDVARPRTTSAPPPSGPWVRLEVTDDGPGIAPAILNRIFDPFFTTKAAGTGLGLSIAQQVVNENRAHLEVSSTRGGPTTFAILVPAQA